MGGLGTPEEKSALRKTGTKAVEPIAHRGMPSGADRNTVKTHCQLRYSVVVHFDRVTA